MQDEKTKTVMADYAILSLARKPRTYAELATMARLLNDGLTPESLHGDEGHIARLGKAGLIEMKPADGDPGISRSVISITENGTAFLQSLGFPLFPLGESEVRNFLRSPQPA